MFLVSLRKDKQDLIFGNEQKFFVDWRGGDGGGVLFFFFPSINDIWIHSD